MRIDLPTAENPVTIICGDSLEILPHLPAGCIDAVVTDPPYGIGEAAGRNKSRGLLALPTDYGDSDWDNKPCPSEAIAEIRRVSRWQIIFGGNYFDLPPSSCWLVWDKLNGMTDFADCELAWTNLPKAVRRLTHRWNGMLREGNEARFHPTQKPLAVMRWCIRQLPDGCDLLFDPFGGSGTTAVAAILEGRRCIVIEKDPRYVEIIRRRVDAAMGDAKGSLFHTPAPADLFAESQKLLFLEAE